LSGDWGNDQAPIRVDRLCGGARVQCVCLRRRRRRYRADSARPLDPDSNPDSNPDADAHAHAHAYSNTDAHSHSDTYPYTYPNTYARCYMYSCLLLHVSYRQ